MSLYLLERYERPGGSGCGGGGGINMIRYEYHFDTETEQVVPSQTEFCDVEGVGPAPDWIVESPFFGQCLLGTRTYREYSYAGDGVVTSTDFENDARCNPPIVVTATTYNTCFSGSTGGITLAIEGGTAPYTFLWSDGATTQDRSLVPAGLYSVTVTDSIGQAVTEEVQVGSFSQITVVGTTGNDSITLTVTGGTAPYTFLWSDGVTTQNRENISAGTYACTITDANGCTATVDFEIVGERFYFSRNPVLLELQADAPETKPNLTFLCEVWVELDYLSEVFVKVTDEPLEHPADSEGKAVFNVRKFLHAFLDPHFPDFGQTTITLASKMFKRFYLKHTEKFGDPPVPSAFSQIEIRYVLLGGLSEDEHYAQTFFTSYLANRKPFFTWDLPVKEVFTDQPEYLFFMPQTLDLQAFQVMAKVTFSDFTTATYQVFEQAGLQRFELYCIPVGHDQLDLGTKKPATTVRSWDIYVRDHNGNIISETRRFLVNTAYYRQKRYLLYDNSLGGINTLVALGPGKEKLDPEVQQMERVRTPHYDPADGDVIIIDKYFKPSLELSTGHRPRLQIRAMKDFILSKQIRLLTADRYLTPTLVVKNVVPDDENENFLYIDFELQLPKEYNYTPALKAAGYPDDVTSQLKPMEP